MTQPQCLGEFDIEENRAFLPVSLTIYHIIALRWHHHLTDHCKTVVYSLPVSLRDTVEIPVVIWAGVAPRSLWRGSILTANAV